MNPLLALLATQPQLMLDHAQGYAALFNEELALASAAWRRRVLLHAVGLCSLSVVTVLAGVGTKLWFTTAAPGSHPSRRLLPTWAVRSTPIWPCCARRVGHEHVSQCLRAAGRLARATAPRHATGKF